MRVLLLGLISWCLSISVARACKCEGASSVESAYQNAYLVVVGKITHKGIVSLAETMEGQQLSLLEQELKGGKDQVLHHPMVVKVELQVTKLIKGKVDNQKVIIYTPIASASCGYQLFKVGELFKVYGYQTNFFAQLFFKRKDLEKPGTFWTSHCTPTTRVNR